MARKKKKAARPKKKTAKALSSKALQSIVEEQMPGFTVVKVHSRTEPPASDATSSDAVSPSIAKLQQKYLKGVKKAGNSEKETRFKTGTAHTVEVKSTAEDDTGPGTKTVLVSEDGKIIGAQG
jgi:hypothetical protein